MLLDRPNIPSHARLARPFPSGLSIGSDRQSITQQVPVTQKGIGRRQELTRADPVKASLRRLGRPRPILAGYDFEEPVQFAGAVIQSPHP